MIIHLSKALNAPKCFQYTSSSNYKIDQIMYYIKINVIWNSDTLILVEVGKKVRFVMAFSLKVHTDPYFYVLRIANGCLPQGGAGHSLAKSVLKTVY